MHPARIVRTGVGFCGVLFLAELWLCVPISEAVVIHPPGTITSDQTWLASDNVHVLLGDLTVASGVTLTIQPGCIVKLGTSGCGTYAALLVDGTLTAVGSAGAPITFTSYLDDAIGGDTNGDGSATTAGPGQWERIKFSGLSTGSVMDYCTIRYGGRISSCSGGNPAPMIDIVGSSPLLNHCRMRSSYSQAVSFTNGSVATLQNSSITSSGSYAVFQSLDASPTLQADTLSGNPGNGIALPGGTLTADNHWRNMGAPYILTDDVTVASGVALTIDPGCVIKLSSPGCGTFAALFVDGTLSATGTVAMQIYFTSYLDDAIGGDTNGDGSATTPGPGQWERIKFSGLSTGSVMDYCTIRYGGRISSCSGGNPAPMIDIVGSSPLLDHCTIRFSYSQAVSFTGETAATLHNSSMTSSGSYAVIQSLDASPTLQAVTLTGNPGNGIALSPGTLGADNRWRNMGLPYILTGDVTIASGVTLTIDPGCIIKLASPGCGTFAGLFVDGTLSAVGTGASPIYFTSYLDDAIGSDTNGDGSTTTPGPGQWERIKFSGLSTGSVMDYCTIRYGGRISSCSGGNPAPMIDIVGSSPLLDHCTIRFSYSQAVSFTGETAATLQNSSIASSGSYAVIQSLDASPTLQAVTLTGNPGNGIALSPGALGADNHWRNMGLPYILTDDVTVASGVTLTIDPGCVIKLASPGCGTFAGLFVDGTLSAVGTGASPIYFTSYLDDAVGGDTNGDLSVTTPAAGQWESIKFSNLSKYSIMDFCFVRYGGRISSCSGQNPTPMIDISGSSPTLDHCTIGNGFSTLVQCSGGANPTINRSSLLASISTLGLNNSSPSVTIDARLNWWGDGTGPYDPSSGPPSQNTGGLGCKVSDFVAYTPWLTTITPPVAVEGPDVPKEVWLGPMNPNPSRASGVIRFGLPSEGNVSLIVYNLSGRIAKTILRDHLQAGAHSVTWDGRDEFGRRLGGGVYFCRLTTVSGVRSKTLIRLP